MKTFFDARPRSLSTGWLRRGQWGILLAGAWLVGVASAQNAALPESAASASTSTTAPAPAPVEQRFERITIEDSGSKIEELRYGGETRQIIVQPKTKTEVPAYRVLPSDRNEQGSSSGRDSTGTTGRTVWEVKSF